MADTYVIEKITEDDFGCEERDESAPLMALCLAVSDDGKEREWVRVPDSILVEFGIEEGTKIDKVFLDKLTKK